MFKIYHPASCLSEREYIFKVMFKDFLGIPYATCQSDDEKVTISLNDRSMTLNDQFFQKADAAWLLPESLPAQPLNMWDSSSIAREIKLMSQKVPVIFGEPFVKLSKSQCTIGLDIFGSCFFMLSRYEEVVKTDRDVHDRFHSKASLAFQENFLDRPIVNEYLEILWACMKALWPELKRRQRHFKMCVTADVDRPYSPNIKRPARFLRQIGGDLIVRKNPRRAFRSTINGIMSLRGNFSFDPNYPLFDWMMSVNERANNQMTFYFMTGITRHKVDGVYSLDEPAIRNLLNRIHSRGHEIGLHPGYETYQDAELVSHEFKTLQRVLDEEKIIQDSIGSRQHYLRWETPTTPRNLAMAGIQYDSTLSFADHAGFRSGVCYEYPLYDVIERKSLNLREKPPIVMEASVFEKTYMNQGFTDKAMQTMRIYREACKKYDGDFVLLWHNSGFFHKNAKKMYLAIIQ